MQNKIVKLGLILLVICMISGGLLSVANYYTLPLIEKAKLEAEQKALSALIPGSSEIEKADKELIKQIKEKYKKFEDLNICKDESGNMLGYAIKTLNTVKGYSGDIELLVGLSTDGKVIGVSVVKQTETKGIGSKVEDKDYQDQFMGKSADSEIKIVMSASADNEVQAITGATYSSKSFTSAINNAFNVYRDFIK